MPRHNKMNFYGELLNWFPGLRWMGGNWKEPCTNLKILIQQKNTR